MSFTITTPRLGVQPIATSSTVQNHPVGTVVKAADPTLGEGEFIYLPGVASTAVGDVVVYDTKAGTTTLMVAASRGAVGVAMSANVASQYGWYQVSGANASVVAASGTAGSPAYTTATAGSVSTTVVAGDKIDGMVCTVAGASGVAGFQLDRPGANGNG